MKPKSAEPLYRCGCLPEPHTSHVHDGRCTWCRGVVSAADTERAIHYAPHGLRDTRTYHCGRTYAVRCTEYSSELLDVTCTDCLALLAPPADIAFYEGSDMPGDIPADVGKLTL